MFKIEWDKKNNGVILSVDGSKDTINVPPRPVFYEELDVLGLQKLGWKYPQSKQPLLWACERRYFHCGEEVMLVKGGNLYDNPTIEIRDAGVGLKLMPIDLQTLKKKNEKILSWIEYEAINFIIDTFRRYSTKQIDNVKASDEVDYVALAAKLEKRTKQKHVVIKEDCDSFDIMPLKEATEQGKRVVATSKSVEMVLASFSGGKDSMVLLDLVSRALPPSEFVVIYSDTGYELPTSIGTYERVKQRYKSISDDYQFYTAQNHQDILYYWDKIGSPSNIHRWCCSVMKTAPLYRLMKEIHGQGKQPRILTFDGVRADESESRSGYSRVGKAVKHNNVINARPILEWNDTEIWLYVLLHELELNEGYRMGYSRVGCIICPFGNERTDFLGRNCFSSSLKPFEEQLKVQAIKSGVRDVAEYLKTRKWKLRAGGREMNIDSKVEFVSVTPDFKAIVHNPQTDFWEWLQVIGPFKTSTEGEITHGEIAYRKELYAFQFTQDRNKNTLTIVFPNIGKEVVLVGLLKRILYKTTHCIHCEACEVECPTGALTVVEMGINQIRIDSSKCTHCLKCINFNDKGCIVANSLTEQTSQINNMTKNSGSIDRYNTFGCRSLWIDKFMNNTDGFFNSSDHGLNEKKQIPAFAKWLVDAELLQGESKLFTLLTELLSTIYLSKPEIIWELIWINISKNSRICQWFNNSIQWGTTFSREELISILTQSFPEYQEKTLTNGLQSLMNTFKESPILGSIIGQCTPVNKLTYRRESNYLVSKVGIAYLLYRYAERNNTYNFRVMEMMRFDVEGSVYNLFGVEEEYFKAILRTLHSEKEPVLHADLNMGLDHISLRSELTSTQVVEIMLRQL